jgi:hypothetical protein
VLSRAFLIAPPGQLGRSAALGALMDNYLGILSNEFEAGSDSFISKLRPDLNWDKAAFTRLTTAMKVCCERQSSAEQIERWIARGFWYIPRFVREWTTHPNFPKPYPIEYYDRAYERLDDLGFWFFFGQSPYVDNTGFDPL